MCNQIKFKNDIMELYEKLSSDFFFASMGRSIESNNQFRWSIMFGQNRSSWGVWDIYSSVENERMKEIRLREGNRFI